MKRHPAMELFERLFNEVAADPGPVLPTYFVTQDFFFKEVKKAGIDAPSNIVDFWAWEESIGLPDFAHRVISKYHKEHGSDYTPMEKQSWRMRQKRKRNNPT